MTSFAFNPDAEVKLVRVGRHGIKVSVIDNVLNDPHGLAALGFSQSYAEDRSNLYPGIRAAMPDSFSISFRAWLTPILQRNDMLESHLVIARDVSFFSVVTTASKDLLSLQRIPHYDSTDSNLLAAVIYLCGPRFSGTAFYRHRRTGYEEITEENVSNYQLALNSDLRMYGPPQQDYINGDSPMFEAVFANELKFNSAIVYPARILHAARIEKGFKPPKDQSEWRLTVTALLHLQRS
ncbi:DUF6445 family protein [Steroidobacter flavus]|uniref:DUF6445 family protein n=1 Tax=Steroidobacter flavus TaxID=1842136 RepID=A0ABV8T5W2_9GAMM